MMDELEAAARRVRDKIRAGELDIYSIKGDNQESPGRLGTHCPPIRRAHLCGIYDNRADRSLYTYFLGGRSCAWDGPSFLAPILRQFRQGRQRRRRVGTAQSFHVQPHHMAYSAGGRSLLPGSHWRYRTEAKRDVLIERPRDSLAGEQTIAIKRGQTVFWNGNTILRGVAPKNLHERMSLRGDMIQYQEDDPSEEMIDERFRWRLSPKIRENIPAKM